MPITIINAKDYSSRTDLENKVRALVELSPDLKLDYQIIGIRKELERLQLSDSTTFYGIRCVITDTPIESKPQTEKPQRGEIKKFGLNLEK